MSTHPDLEALNAVLDGESEGEGDTGHVAGCAACQARLAQLRTVQTAVGGPVTTPAADVRDAAIARALASVAAPGRDAGAEEAPPSPPTELRRRGGGRVWESPVWRWAAGSAAAAVLAIAVLT